MERRTAHSASRTRWERAAHPVVWDGASGVSDGERAVIYSTTRPSSPGSGSGIRGSRPVNTSTSSEATATSRTHLWSAGTTYHGAHPVEVAEIASSYRAWYSSQCERVSRSE